MDNNKIKAVFKEDFRNGDVITSDPMFGQLFLVGENGTLTLEDTSRGKEIKEIVPGTVFQVVFRKFVGGSPFFEPVPEILSSELISYEPI